MVTQEIMRWVKEWVAGWTKTRFFSKSDHQLTSRGAASSGYPLILDSTGKVDGSFIPSSFATDTELATHAALTVAHGATGAVVGTTNTQLLENKTVRSRADTINDDAVVSFVPILTSGILLVACNNDNTASGIAAFRCTGTNYCASLASLSNFNVTTGALTGTTGTDNKVTVSTDNAGNIYIENRRGTPLIFKTLVVG